MKIMGILGAPRKGGNTETLLDLALAEAQAKGVRTEKISLRDKSIAPCDGCLVCRQTGECVIEDDAQGVYREMLDSDGIIWATPVYFWSMSGQTKIMMERTYALLFPRLQLMNKVGGLILVAGGRGCMSTANVFQQYFTYNHMFFTEFAWGYASGRGEITANGQAAHMAREMVLQMIALIDRRPKYPEEFDAPLNRYVSSKYQL